MHEMWTEVSRMYQQMKTSPPNDEVCRCITDVENNGILDMLRIIGLRLREPELMYGGHQSRPRQGRARQLEVGRESYNFCCVGYQFRFKRDTTQEESDLENVFLQDEDDAMPKLTDEESWVEWKNVMQSMTDAEIFHLAMFLYCKLEFGN